MRERDETHYGAEAEGDPEGAGSEGHIKGQLPACGHAGSSIPSAVVVPPDQH